MRGTLPSIAVAVAATFVFSACGVSTRDNQPRPPVPTTLAVSIADDGIDVSPLTLGRFGQHQQNLSQNRTARRSQSKHRVPLAVRGAIANLTRTPTRLIIQGPVDRTVPVTPSGSTSFTAALPTGIYRLSSPSSSKTTLLTVGPARNSSATDVLTP